MGLLWHIGILSGISGYCREISDIVKVTYETPGHFE